MKNVLPPSRFLTKNFLYSAASTDGAHTPTPWCSATSLSRLQLQSYKTFLKWRNIWKRITHRERFPVRNALLEHRPRPIISVNALFQIFLTKQVWMGEFYLISENNHPSYINHQPSYISHHTSAILHQPSYISHLFLLFLPGNDITWRKEGAGV